MNLQQYQEKYKEDRFYREVFENKIYWPVLKEKSDVVLDVGACAGEFSIWMYDKAKEIYALEPEKEQFEELKENIKDFPKIKAFKLALNDRNGAVSLGGNGRGSYTTSNDYTVDSTREFVDGMTLATFITKNNIERVDILKIDIENGERAVFLAPDFPSVADKIRFIIGEHLGIMEVTQKLLDLGFEGENHDGGKIFRRHD